jgi:kinetochore protein NDC80
VANCQRSILEYLISANYPVPISLKTLQVPTSKDFATIFKFLYNRLDPNYQFMKKIEDEVILCLKALKYQSRLYATNGRYPFVDSMSKSNISAVGSQHSWPGILAMLSWMVDVCVVCPMTRLVLMSTGQRKVDARRNSDGGIRCQLSRTRIL